MKSHRDSQTEGTGGGMALFWEGLQSFGQGSGCPSLQPSVNPRGLRLSCARNCNGFSAKASTRVLLHSAHSTAGHKISRLGEVPSVCVLESSSTALQSCLVLLSAPSCSRGASGDRSALGSRHQPLGRAGTAEMSLCRKSAAMGLFCIV